MAHDAYDIRITVGKVQHQQVFLNRTYNDVDFVDLAKLGDNPGEFQLTQGTLWLTAEDETGQSGLIGIRFSTIVILPTH